MASKRKGYIDELPRMLGIFKERLSKEIQDYRVNGLPKVPQVYYESIELICRSIAIGELMVNKDVVAAKKYFYMSAMLRKVIIEKIQKQGDIGWYEAGEETDAMYMALLSDKEDLVEELAELSRRIKTHEDSFVWDIFYAINNILLGKMEEAKSNVDKMQPFRERKDLKNWVDIIDILQAIIENDEENLNKSLQHFASIHYRLKGYKGTPDETMSLEVLGLAKLAIRQGLNVSIDHPKAPTEILAYKDIEYPVIDFVD